MTSEIRGLPPLLVGLSALLVGFIALLAHPEPSPADMGSLSLERSGGYAGSDACFSCHPSEHGTWKASHHSSMTRTVGALFDGSARHPTPEFPVDLVLDRVSFRLERREEDGRLLVTGPDLHVYASKLTALHGDEPSPELLGSVPIVTRPIALLTGSHHYLALWVAGAAAQELRLLPFVYRFEEERWLPRREVFLQPPDAVDHVGRFNANCIQCHTVAARPGQSEGRDATTGAFWQRYDSKAADLGISCESCHGPAQQHVDWFANPWNRHRARGARRDEPRGFGSRFPEDHPARLFVPHTAEAEASTAVCAQCHSYFLPRDPDQWWESGFFQGFRPGDRSDPSRTELTFERLIAGGKAIGFSADLPSLYWKNGSMIVGGREANGLRRSACATPVGDTPALTCVHCHSMHGGDPDAQMDPRWSTAAKDEAPQPASPPREGAGAAIERSNGQCVQCHDVSADHSAHQPGSAGTRCVSCHMPETSYALLSGVRSHHIIVPPRVESLATAETASTELTEAPHPCMLCHADRSRSWIGRQRERLWPGSNSSVPLAPEESPTREPEPVVPWAVERALNDHAGVRAVLLWALASPDALTTAGPGPFEAVVARLQHDPVAAVRHVARRAHGRRRLWTNNPASQMARQPRSVGPPNVLDRLFEGRDRRPITISE